MNQYQRSIKLVNELPDSLKIMVDLDHELALMESIEQILIECRVSALSANATTRQKQKAETLGRRDFKKLLSDNRRAKLDRLKRERESKRKAEIELRIGLLSAAYAVGDEHPFELVGKFPSGLIPDGNGEQFLRLAVDIFGLENVKTMLAEY